jgi:hypothetical protein
MSEKLYKADFKFTVMFVANNVPVGGATSPEEKAYKFLLDELSDNGYVKEDLNVVEVKDRSDMAGWENMHPWGTDYGDERTCLQHLLDQKKSSCDGKVVEIDGKKYRLTEVK